MIFHQQLAQKIPQKNSSFWQLFASTFFWDENLSKTLQYFFFCATNIQFIATLIWYHFQFISAKNKDFFSQSLHRFSTILTICDMNLAEVNNQTITILIVTWAYFLILLILACALTVKVGFRSSSTNNRRKQNYLIFFLSQFQLSIAFWIINFVVIKFMSMGSGTQTLYIDGAGVQVLKISCFLLVVLNYILTLFLSLFSVDPFKNSNVLATHTSNFQILTFIAKGILSPIFTLTTIEKPGMIWSFTVAAFLLSSARHYVLVKTFPYYQYMALKRAITFSLMVVLISGLNLLLLALKESSMISGTTISYTTLILFPLSSKFSEIYLKNSIQRSLVKIGKSSYKESEIIQILFALNCLVQKSKTSSKDDTIIMKSQFYMLGLMSNNLDFKKFLNLPYQNDSKEIYKEPSENMTNFVKLREIFVSYVLTDFIEKGQTTNKLQIIFACETISQENINLRALTQLLSAARNGGIVQIIAQNILNKIESKIDIFFWQKEQGAIDMKGFVDTQEKLHRFLKMIRSNSKKVAAFWQAYLKSEPKVIELYKKSKLIENEDIHIGTFWDRNELVLTPLRALYSVYLFLIRNAPYSAEKIRKKPNLLEQKIVEESDLITGQTINSASNIVLYISLTKEKSISITNISPNIYSHTGYNQEHFLNKGLTALFPSFLKDHINTLVLNHIEGTFTTTQICQNIDVFLRTRQNSIIPAYLSLSLSPSPSLQGELGYVGIMRPKKLGYQQILIDQQGMIEGFTKDIGQELDISNERRMYIEDLYANLEVKLPSLRKTKSSTPFPDSETTAYSLFRQDRFSKLDSTSQYSDLRLEHDIWTRLNKLMGSSCLKDYKLELNSQSFGKSNIFILSLRSSSINQISERRKQIRTQNAKETIFKFEERLNESDLDIPNKKPTTEEIDNQTSHRQLLHNTIETPKSPLKKSTFYTSYNVYPTQDEQLKSAADDKQNEDLELSSIKVLKTSLGVLRRKLERAKTKQNKDKDTSSQSSLTNHQYSNLEQAIYNVPKQPLIRNYNMLLVIFIVISCTLLCVFAGQNRNHMDLLRGNINVLSLITPRQVRILLLFYLTSIFRRVDGGIFSIDRYSWAGIPNVKTFAVAKTTQYSLELNKINMAIRNYVESIDQDLQRKLYDKVPINDTDQIVPNRTVNLFDFTSEIATAASTLQFKQYSDLKGTDPEITFIQSNSLDNLLLGCESSTPVVMDDNQQKLQRRLLMIGIYTAVNGFFLLVLFKQFLDIVRAFIIERRKILGLLLKTDLEEIKRYNLIVQNFCETIERSDIMARKLPCEEYQLELVTTVPRTDKPQRSKHRLGDEKGINKQIIKISLAHIFFLLVLFSGYIALCSLVSQQNKYSRQRIDLMVTTNSYLYELAVAFTALPRYIGNQATTLRTRPIKQEWPETYTNLTKIQDQLLSLTQPDTILGYNQKLYQLMTGNLCQIAALKLPEMASVNCDILLNSEIEKGLIWVNSFLIRVMQLVALEFQGSHQTRQDATNALANEDLIHAEPTMLGYIYPGYELAGQLIKEQIDNDFDKAQRNIEATVIVYALIHVVFLFLVRTKLREILEDEQAAWRKMIRLFPYNMVANNRMFQKYLDIS